MASGKLPTIWAENGLRKKSLPFSWPGSSVQVNPLDVNTTRPSASALHALALTQLRNDEFVQAARTIRKLLLVLPPNHSSRPSMLTVLAFAHLEAGEVDEAQRVARHATTLDPENVLAWQQVRRAEEALKAS
jgi:Flp pilus assembly protein TadD